MDYNKWIHPAKVWFRKLGWEIFPFQEDAWQAYREGYNGIVNASTGSGKTYSLWIPVLLDRFHSKKKRKGVKAIWITPIKALSKEIFLSTNRAVEGIGAECKIGVRTGDTSATERSRMKKDPPDLLITTPESLHLLLAQKNSEHFFRDLESIIVDEWHELLGSKRGVQVELALSRLRSLLPGLGIWGISATIGNLDQALQVLLGFRPGKSKIIRSEIEKLINVYPVLPDSVETMPWGGHLGIKLLDKVIPLIKSSKTTLIFTNTRSQAEIWYQRILDREPNLAGVIAMHHGSISKELRIWVEEALHEERLKAVICTSSLDLGVDFRPVETIIQIGSPKGIARFVQRAGRSGHKPGEISKIYFVPTHSLELIESSSLRTAIEQGKMEARKPYIRSYDTLIQYLTTLAVGDGFQADKVFREIRSTHCFRSLDEDEWLWILNFITKGGQSLRSYDEFQKVVVENGRFLVKSRRVAMRHRMSIGTIVSDPMLGVKIIGGKRLGLVEEYFVSRMRSGDVFWFAGQNLEFIKIKDMTVLVRKSNKRSGRIPAWQGGRLPLSSSMSEMLRYKIMSAGVGNDEDEELRFLQPLINLQRERSHVPSENELLIEYFESQLGWHLVIFPFEGRNIHEVMGALLAYRIGLQIPASFSIGMNDYGFELLSDQKIDIEDFQDILFDLENLMADTRSSINGTEMALRKFRDIAGISGLVFKGYPGKPKKERHIQSTASLFFKVFTEHEPDNLLLRQAFDEVYDFELEEDRFIEAIKRINSQKIIITRPIKPTPFSFPIIAEGIRERVTYEHIEDRIRKMQLQYSQ